MTLYDTLERINRFHKRVYKNYNGDKKIFYGKSHTMTVSAGYIEFENDENKAIEFILSTTSYDTGRHNNSYENSNYINYLFKTFYEEENIKIITSGKEFIIGLPRYNDNEEELLFQLRTIAINAESIALSAMLMTLDTKFNTLYTREFKIESLESFNECLTEGDKWISNHIQTHSKL